MNCSLQQCRASLNNMAHSDEILRMQDVYFDCISECKLSFSQLQILLDIILSCSCTMSVYLFVSVGPMTRSLYCCQPVSKWLAGQCCSLQDQQQNSSKLIACTVITLSGNQLICNQITVQLSVITDNKTKLSYHFLLFSF